MISDQWRILAVPSPPTTSKGSPETKETHHKVCQDPQAQRRASPVFGLQPLCPGTPEGRYWAWLVRKSSLSSRRSGPELLPKLLSSQQGCGEGEQRGWNTISVGCCPSPEPLPELHGQNQSQESLEVFLISAKQTPRRPRNS